MTPRRTDSTVIPIHEEDATVSKRTVQRRAHIETKVRTRTDKVEVTLRRERPVIERVPINREVSVVPPVRQEDDTLVIPVVEEVAVIERRLMLREEIRVRRQEFVEPFRQDVTLRTEEVVIDGAPLDTEVEVSPTQPTKARKED